MFSVPSDLEIAWGDVGSTKMYGTWRPFGPEPPAMNSSTARPFLLFPSNVAVVVVLVVAAAAVAPSLAEIIHPGSDVRATPVLDWYTQLLPL